MPIYAFDCLMGQSLVYARNEQEAYNKAMRQSRKFGLPYPTKLRLATGADIVYAATQGRYIPKEEDSEDHPESSTKR